jgi:hypothetical protein
LWWRTTFAIYVPSQRRDEHLVTVDCRAGERLRVADAIDIVPLGWSGQRKGRRTLALCVEVPEGCAIAGADEPERVLASAMGRRLLLLWLQDGEALCVDGYRISVHRLRAQDGTVPLRNTALTVHAPEGATVTREPRGAARRRVAAKAQ